MIAVGCDWACKSHQFVVLSAARNQLARFIIPHSTAGLAEAARQLAELEPDPSQVCVAIESHDGPLVDWLEDQGYAVMAVNPKTSCAARDLLSSSGSKDDVRDATTLAQLVLMEVRRPAPHRGQDRQPGALTALLRQRERRVRERTQTLLRLQQILQQWAPGLASLCHSLDRLWTRHLLERWPLEQDLHQADRRTLVTFATKHRLQAKTVERIHETRRARPFPVRPERAAALRREIQHLLLLLDAILREVQSLEEEIDALVKDDPAHEVLQSLPRTGLCTEAAWLVALRTAGPEDPSWRSVAVYAGLSPVTRASGASRSVRYRRCRDAMLQRLLTYHAFESTLVEGSWAQQTYREKRRRGVSHYTALRSIAQRWAKIIHAMLRDNTQYDEEAHQSRRNQNTLRAA